MATVRNLLTRQQSSKYYYQVRESSNSISCLKFHIEKKCRGMINLDNHYSIKPETRNLDNQYIINPLSLHAILNFSFFSLHFVSFGFVSFCFISFRFFRYISFRYILLRFVTFRFVSFLFVRFHFVSHFTGTLRYFPHSCLITRFVSRVK